MFITSVSLSDNGQTALKSFFKPERPQIDRNAGNGNFPVKAESSLPKAQRLILTALAQYPQGRSKVQIALLAGYAHNGGGFSNSISSVRCWSLQSHQNR